MSQPRDDATVRPGPTNSLLDITGLRVGHVTRREPGWLTGTTVVLAPEEGVVAGVDVRGGGPGTRETDLLDPRNVVERVHAICLSGGSAFGLAAADGVMRALFDDGIGLSMGEPGQVVPLVPAAVVFDLGRGGDFANRPDHETGRAAYEAAKGSLDEVNLNERSSGFSLDVAVTSRLEGVVGAGTGAKCGGFKGGIGSASAALPDGATVAALVVLNALGEAVDPATGELYARRFLLSGELDGLGVPSEQEAQAARERASSAPPQLVGRPGMATTIGVVATDATLTKAQCAKLAGIAHDGLARAVKPVHTMFDGDTFFGAATCERAAPDLAGFHGLLDAGGDAVTRAVAHALLAAETVTTPAGTWPSYREAFPSAVARLVAPDSARDAGGQP